MSAPRGGRRTGAPKDARGFLPARFHLITAALNQRFLERLRPHGVTVQRWRVLMMLDAEGPCGMSRLMRLTLIPQSALSRLIDQMERDALVRRRAACGDQRVVEVELTRRGAAMRKKLAPVAAEHSEAIFAGFSPQERATLDALLARVLDNLDVPPPDPFTD